MVNYDGLYNKEFYGDRLTGNYFSTKKLYFQTIENGTILPHKPLTINGKWTWGFGGIVDSTGRYIKDSFVQNGTGGEYTPVEEVQYRPSTVVYLGMFFTVWGHCISDNLKNVWFLQNEVYKKYFKDCPIVYVPIKPVSQDIKNFFKLLKILDIDINKCYPITTPIQFQNIIIPDPAMFVNEISGSRIFTDEYRETIDRIKNFALKQSTPIANKKIYFSISRTQIGEERLAGYLKSKDYAVINPATLDFEDEINLLINCEEFATTIGSSSHNVIFLNKNARALIIPRANYLSFQPTLDQVYDIDINYVDSTLSIFAPDHNGPFYYIISDNLKKYFGEEVTGEYSYDDFLNFFMYFFYAKSQKLNECSQMLEYLKDIFPNFMDQLESHMGYIKDIQIKIKSGG